MRLIRCMVPAARSSSMNGKSNIAGRFVLAIALVFLPALTRAQTDAASVQAAATITAAAIVRQVGVLADDSMRGRATPSPELERTAQYLIDQFRQLGLQPGIWHAIGDSSASWWQRYPLPGQRRLDYARSRMALEWLHTDKDTQTKWKDGTQVDFTTAVRFLPQVGPPVVPEKTFTFGMNLFLMNMIRVGSPRAVVVSGRYTAASVRPADLQDKVVFYIPPAGLDSARRDEVLTALYIASRGVIFLSEADSAHFAAALQPTQRSPVPLVDGYLRDVPAPRRWPWVVEVWPAALHNADRKFLTDVGIDLAQVRADTTPTVRELPSTEVWLDLTADTTATPNFRTAPNVVAALEGTDSVLKNQYIVISAHMDARGVRAGEPDSIENGADDNASGVAGLLALARAFCDAGARPQRSLLFVGLSGGAKDSAFWGSNFFTQSTSRILGFTWGGRALVADINLDMIGRAAGDSVVVDGMRDVELGVSPDWVATAHPELNLRVVDGGTAFSPRSDHFPFVRNSMPSLYFHNGFHANGNGAGDEPAKLNAEQEARIVRLVFYVVQEIANAAAPPTWSLEGRKRFLDLQQEP